MKSHVQVNINKVLEHLRTIGKFNTRHLWSNNDIAVADPKTVWELMDDMWHFYSNKNNLNKKEILKKKNKIENFHNLQNLQNIQNIQNLSTTKHNNISKIETGSNKSLFNNNKLEKNNKSKQNLLNENSANRINTFTAVNDSDLENPSPYTSIMNTYNENLQRVKNLSGGFEKYTDVASFQKFQKENSSNNREISSILNINLNTQISSKEKANESMSNNLTAIANCLGMDSTKARRKRDGPSSSSFRALIESNTNRNLSFKQSKSPDKDNKIFPTMESRRSLRKNLLPPSSNRNSPKAAHKLFISNKNTSRKDSKSKEPKDNSCFIIFQKSNAKKLKKEIEKFPLRGKGTSFNNSENSIYITDDLNFSNSNFNLHMNNEKLKSVNNSNPLMASKKFITEPEINFENPQIMNMKKITTDITGKSLSPNPLQVISSSTEEESIKSRSKQKIIPEEKDESGLKEWLITLGIKEAYAIDFSKEEISEFKDGLFINLLVSTLENKKIGGVNPNPRSSSSMIKNISKSLEILRNKKVNFDI